MVQQRGWPFFILGPCWSIVDKWRFPEMGIPKIVGLWWTIPLQWMIYGYPHPIFTKPPNDCMCGIVQEAMSKCHNIGIFDLQYSAAFLQQSWRMSEQSYLINPIIDHIMSLTVFLSFSFTKQNKTYKTRDTHGSRNRNSTELLPGRSLPEGRSSATSSNHTSEMIWWLNHQKKTFWHLKLRDGS